MGTFGLSKVIPLKLTFTNKAKDIYIPKPAQPYPHVTNALLHESIFSWGLRKPQKSRNIGTRQ